ncbi:MAG TPA: glycoside hydrolase family 127 protein, partial [Anaerolineales bacterium]|nr:glycoside hydrolase family 127 protein [Anaerolineales bacterium]
MTDPHKKSQAYQFLSFGAIKPSGWIRTQMSRDLEHGFVGCLDELVPALIQNDDIYGADRLTKAARTKELGVVAKETQWEVQFLWWNSETQSNWLDGMLRTTLLLDHPLYFEKARTHIERLLATQDTDGYLGIYAPDLRFNFTGENGELWAQASLFRVLLGWYEATRDERALTAVRHAVAVTMQAYPMGQSRPFDVKDDFAGVGHGLVFTDILDRLYQLTTDKQYLAYAHWFYEEYSRQPLSQDDIQIANLLDPNHRFKAHGVHTYEQLRSLLAATVAAADSQLDSALAAALAKLETCLTPSGAPIGDEFIAGREADASETGYEYCSIHELLDTYTHLLQKTGDIRWADRAEWLFFNAAQGARHPSEPSIAYLKTDNSFSMTGSLHPDDPQDEQNPQIRYKYSPVHQDVAVCCVPNAGRIAPYYIKAMWLRSEDGFVKALYGASVFQAEINGVSIKITETSNYPFDTNINFQVDVSEPIEFTLSFRKPEWSKQFKLTGADEFSVRGNLIQVRKNW